MKPLRNKEGSYEVIKGKIRLEIINGRDKFPYRPVSIKYDGEVYPIKVSLERAINAFRNTYSEEQVFEVLFKLTQE